MKDSIVIVSPFMSLNSIFCHVTFLNFYSLEHKWTSLPDEIVDFFISLISFDYIFQGTQ